MDDFSMRREDLLGMGESRLARLEEQARTGYANPSQMLKLVAEVRRRRREMNAMRETIRGLALIADISIDEDTGRWRSPTEEDDDVRGH